VWFGFGSITCLCRCVAAGVSEVGLFGGAVKGKCIEAKGQPLKFRLRWDCSIVKQLNCLHCER